MIHLFVDRFFNNKYSAAQGNHSQSGTEKLLTTVLSMSCLYPSPVYDWHHSVMLVLQIYWLSTLSLQYHMLTCMFVIISYIFQHPMNLGNHRKKLKTFFLGLLFSICDINRSVTINLCNFPPPSLCSMCVVNIFLYHTRYFFLASFWKIKTGNNHPKG